MAKSYLNGCICANLPVHRSDINPDCPLHGALLAIWPSDDSAINASLADPEILKRVTDTEWLRRAADYLGVDEVEITEDVSIKPPPLKEMDHVRLKNGERLDSDTYDGTSIVEEVRTLSNGRVMIVLMNGDVWPAEDLELDPEQQVMLKRDREQYEEEPKPQKPIKMVKVCGYCALCRAKELELYDDIINKPGRKHTEACRQAGCIHPADYEVPDCSSMSLEEIKNIRDSQTLSEDVLQMPEVTLEWADAWDNIQRRVKRACRRTGLRCSVVYQAYPQSENVFDFGLPIDNLNVVATLQRIVLIYNARSFGNGQLYISPIVDGPTWMDLAVCANAAIHTTQDHHHVYFEDVFKMGEEELKPQALRKMQRLKVDAVYRLQMGS